MKLQLEKRSLTSKSAIGKIRRGGDIPAVIYNSGKESTPVVVNGKEFDAHLRHIRKGCLATQKFEAELDGKKVSLIVKDIQYHRTTYNIEHIDFMELQGAQEITIHVPVVSKGDDSCVGVTQGGQLKRVKRSVKVSMKASEMPEAFVVDVSGLQLGESIRVKDLDVLPSMKVRLQEHQVLFSVSK